jgi:hypothetical protein
MRPCVVQRFFNAEPGLWIVRVTVERPAIDRPTLQAFTEAPNVELKTGRTGLNIDGADDNSHANR